MSTLEQVRDNLCTAETFAPLTQRELEAIDKVLVEVGKAAVVPCTACEYCVADCPQQIQIPTIFGIYNEFRRSNDRLAANTSYQKIPEGRAAGSCTACNTCVALCPQKIDIPKEFKGIGRIFRR